MSEPPSEPDSQSDEEPMIHFGGEWIPARHAWKRMETATIVVDHIARFNEEFPELSSHGTRDVVPTVRRRLKEVELKMPRRVELPSVDGIATELLQALSPEDVLNTLAEKHDTVLSIEQLIQLTGEKAYLTAVHREAREFELNRISHEQTALLWNELGRPVPGGGLWSAKKVAELLADSADDETTDD